MRGRRIGKERQEAITRGEPRFFTGKPCKHGHIAERFTSGGQCTECAQNYNPIWRANNIDAVREYQRLRNRHLTRRQRKIKNAKARLVARKRRALNPDLINKQQREWRYRNRDKIRAQRSAKRKRGVFALHTLIALGVKSKELGRLVQRGRTYNPDSDKQDKYRRKCRLAEMILQNL